MFKMSWFLLKSSLAPHTHIYLHSNEYKLSVTECIELFMCQMFHPSWCQVPGCHTTGHTGCGVCDANVLLIRYLMISTITTARTPRSRGVTLTVAPWWWRNIFWENSSTSPQYLQSDSVQQSQHLGDLITSHSLQLQSPAMWSFSKWDWLTHQQPSRGRGLNIKRICECV